MNIWIDIDIAVTVPVNVMPLIDNTDFKTREIAIVYNQAGMDLVWNFQTSAGVITQTPVIPTTTGDYDWTHLGDAIYTIGMPASEGISINNDTSGFGWFTGICDGVLAWRGPVLGFRSAALNNSFINGADIPAIEANVELHVSNAINNTIPLYERTDGTLTADGTEQIIYEVTPTVTLVPDSITMSLLNMAADDAVTINMYAKLKSGGSYELIDTQDYGNIKDIPVINITGQPNRYGWKVTLQQTAGINRDYDWERYTLTT